jgi:isopentenyldiphosphate isomerase
MPVVDKNDQIIGYKNRDEIKPEDIYRVSAIWITNSKNEILLAKRHHTKKNDPNKWGPAVAGTVEKDETYKSNIIKEASEELGLINIKPQTGPKTFNNKKHLHFTQWYFLKIDKKIHEFKIKEDEIEEAKWITKKELLADIKVNPENYIDSILSLF